MKIIHDSLLNTSFDDYKVYCIENDFYPKGKLSTDYFNFIKDMKALNEEDIVFEIHRNTLWNIPVILSGYFISNGCKYNVEPIKCKSLEEAHKRLIPSFDSYKILYEDPSMYVYIGECGETYYYINICKAY